MNTSGFDREWLHELRNALNTVVLSAAVVRGLLREGEDARALEFLDDLEQATSACLKLASEPKESPRRN